MRYEIIHRTTYVYADDVAVSHHIARLRPRTLPGQHCLEHDLTVEPAPSMTHSREDYYGNQTTYFVVEGAHRALNVTARSLVDLTMPSAPALSESITWEEVRDHCRPQPSQAPRETDDFVFPSSLVPPLAAAHDYALESFRTGRSWHAALCELTARIYHDFQFDQMATTVATPLERVWQERRGVCQDFAHVQIGCLRSLGLPARYVSGYAETVAPPGVPKLIGADASHAWVQAYVPETGWIDVDPTNNLLPTQRYILVGWGRDFEDVSPLRGVMVGGGHHTLYVGVDVMPRPEVKTNGP